MNIACSQKWHAEMIQKEAFLFGSLANNKHFVIIKRNLVKESYGPIPAKDWRTNK